MCNATPLTSIATYVMPSSRTMTLRGLARLGRIPLTSTSLLPACSSDVTYRRLVQKERSDRQYSQETVSLASGTKRRLGDSGKGLLVFRTVWNVQANEFYSQVVNIWNIIRLTSEILSEWSKWYVATSEQNSTFIFTFGFLPSHPVTWVQD